MYVALLSCAVRASEIWGSAPASKLFDATDALFGYPEFGGNGEWYKTVLPTAAFNYFAQLRAH
jgi:hypothetical protein